MGWSWRSSVDEQILRDVAPNLGADRVRRAKSGLDDTFVIIQPIGSSSAKWSLVTI